MELKMPSPEQAYWGLRAMKTVALADGTLDDSEQWKHSIRRISRIHQRGHDCNAVGFHRSPCQSMI